MKQIFFLVTVFVFLTEQTGSSKAADSEYRYYRGFLTPNSYSPKDCGTSTAADALFKLIDPNIPYAIISVEQVVPVMVVLRAVYQEQPGLSASLEIYEYLGFAGLINKKAYFFSTVGSSNVVYVKNDNSSVNGYHNLTGAFIYQAFEAMKADCNYNCNTASTSILTNIPNKEQSSAGRSSISLRNVNSVSVVATDAVSTSNVYKRVKETLQQAQISSCDLQVCTQCVNVNKKNPFLLSCPVDAVYKKLSNAVLTNSIYNPVFQQKNQLSSYIVSQVQLLNKNPQTVFCLYRIILPATCNSVAVVSFYSTYQLLDAFATAGIGFCG